MDEMNKRDDSPLRRVSNKVTLVTVRCSCTRRRSKKVKQQQSATTIAVGELNLGIPHH
jgi:hypothetical protein